MKRGGKLLVIVGPTASGKSSLGLEVAAALDGEIVSADAFAVYRGLDIGTDKPSPEARRRIPHHLVDVADPRQRFSAGDFAAAADRAIADIRSRGSLPLVVGGSHFYVRALVLGLFPAPAHDAAVRARLEQLWDQDQDALYRQLERIDPESAARVGPADRQRILRALEVFELTGEPLSSHWRRHQRPPRYDALLVAPQRSREELYARIDSRVDTMFAAGLVEEVSQILALGVPRDAHALKAIGYREVLGLLEGRHTLSTAVSETKRSSRRFAKRQLTWLRTLREGELQWVAPAEHKGTATVVELWDRQTKGSGKS
jgi:tRNA dimethylallyltransferase